MCLAKDSYENVSARAHWVCSVYYSITFLTNRYVIKVQTVDWFLRWRLNVEAWLRRVDQIKFYRGDKTTFQCMRSFHANTFCCIPTLRSSLSLACGFWDCFLKLFWNTSLSSNEHCSASVKMILNFTPKHISTVFYLVCERCTLDDSVITEWTSVSLQSHFHLLIWCTPVSSWHFNWYFATYQIALASDEVCLFQFALSDYAGCFLIDFFKFYTLKLLLLSLS